MTCSKCKKELPEDSEDLCEDCLIEKDFQDWWAHIDQDQEWINGVVENG